MNFVKIAQVVTSWRNEPFWQKNRGFMVNYMPYLHSYINGTQFDSLIMDKSKGIL